MTRCIVVMGIAGSGKSTVGRALADELGCVFVEGDDLHPAANVDKMAAGTPLDDQDRRPWLDAIVSEARCQEREGRSTVVACSALKRSYRDRLRAGLDDPAFVYLEIGEAVATRRLDDRQGHFMGSAMVASQLAALEEPGDDEAIVVDAGLLPEEIISRVVGRLS